MQLARSAPNHGIVEVEEVVLEVVVHHDMTQHLDVLRLILMIAASHVMNEVTTLMIAHALEVVVTVEDAEGNALSVLVKYYFLKY